jgi:hypothetical protein
MTRQQKKKIDESHVEEVRPTTFSRPNYNEDPVRWLLLSKAKAKARAPLGHRSLAQACGGTLFVFVSVTPNFRCTSC